MSVDRRVRMVLEVPLPVYQELTRLAINMRLEDAEQLTAAILERTTSRSRARAEAERMEAALRPDPSFFEIPAGNGVAVPMTGGLRPYCNVCGAMVESESCRMGVPRADCPHRVIG